MGLHLANTNTSLVGVLGAAATPAPTFVTSAVIRDQSTGEETEVSFEGVFNGTTPVTLLPAPAKGKSHILKHLTVWNADNVPATVTLAVAKGSSLFGISVTTLATLETLTIGSCGHKEVLTVTGEKKVTTT